MKKKVILIAAIFAGLFGFSILTTSAQQPAEIIFAQKSGRFHLNKAVRVGGKTLEAGMYQVQHILENDEHFVVFRQVEMGFRGNMGNQKLGEETTRVKCAVETVDTKNGGTKLLVRKNADGSREAYEVWIRGERVKHILPTS